MKRLILIVSLMVFSAFLFAQNPDPGRTIFVGSATQNKTVSDTSYSFNVGASVFYMFPDTSTSGDPIDTTLQVGFPYNALYLDQTFAGDLSVSKGYYSDYISLKWEVVNGASAINHFEIYRKKPDEPDSVWVDNVEATARKWEDYFCEPNEIYKYTLHAVGIPGAKAEYYTYIHGIGFRTPLATVTGRVSFSGGNGVKNVVITASTDDEVPSTSLAISGNSYLEMPQSQAVDFSSGFTFQAYVKLPSASTDAGIFQKEGNFELSYTSQNLVFEVGTETVQLPFVAPEDTFFHVTAVYTGDSAFIYVPVKMRVPGGGLVDTTLVTKDEVNNSIAANDNPFLLAKAGTTGFTGNLDEVRIWSRILEQEEVERDYNRYINKNVNGLFAMLRMNEGTGNHAYDISKTGSYFNENHCNFRGSQISWSGMTPTLGQLGHRGITDEEGNYLISGIPFLTGGSPYKFTPMLAPHEFDPGHKILFLSEDALVHNNINFTDISSFYVNGSVVYRNTTLGVRGVEIRVDGEIVFGNDNKPVKTDESGEFEVEVPIGAHYISLRKDGHQFDNGGRWPYDPAYPDSVIRYDFNQNLTFPNPFIDTTLITVIGRVIGGTASNSIPVGFEQSVNNIGKATITLTHDNTADLTFDNTVTGEEIISYTVKTGEDSNLEIQHRMSREEVETMIFTSMESGEFMAKLIPEKFTLVDIDVDNAGGTYPFDNRVIDLSVNPELKYEFLYDEDDQVLDSIPYHIKLNYVYQTTPEINVTNENDSVLFYGEKEITVKNVKDGTEETIVVSDHFLFPIFKSFNDYSPKIAVFESYYNFDIDELSYQPVKEAEIKIVNNLAIQNQVKTYQLTGEMEGVVTDTFKVGLPNVAKSTTDNTSFTKTMEVYVKVEDQTYSWEPGGELYRAYILGQNPKGNNFYTEGPQVPEIILRDPPGTNSYAYIENGSSYSVSSGYSTKTDNGSGFGLDILLGCTVELGGGLAGPVIKTDSKNSASTGLNFSTTVNESGKYVQSYTFTERVQTSSDPAWVGSMADIYIGKSYNYFYGETDNLKILPYDLARDNGVPSLDDPDLKDTLYTLGIVEGFIMDPDNSDTYFKYTQAHILNKLLPELESRRNNLFLGAKYTSEIDISDMRYGVAHSYDVVEVAGDTIIHAYFKNTKEDSILTYTFRPSEEIIYDLNGVLNDTIYQIDSVRYYNNQIGIWIDAIRLNEGEKAMAIEEDELEQNISFDGGVGSISRSEVQTISYNEESSRTKNVNWTAKGSVGFALNSAGLVATGNLKVEHSLGVTVGESFTSTMSYGYTLSDGDAGDYYSVNIYRRTEDGVYNANDLEETKQELPSGFEFGLLGNGVSLVGGAIAVLASASYGAGGGAPIIAGAASMAVAAGLAYIPYTSFMDDVEKEGDKFGPGDKRIGSFDISSPIFSTLGGQTMCPHQDLEHTFFYRDEQGDTIVLHKRTMQREKPQIDIEPSEVHNIPITDKAYYTLKITNNTESGDDQWYGLTVLDGTNPDGALVKVDGLSAKRTYFVPANTTLNKTLTVQPTDLSVMEYDSIGIAVYSTCQAEPTDYMRDIIDIAYISASFQPTCTNVEVLEPLDNWVVNVRDNDTMTVRLGDYNLAFDSFESFRFEYKPSSGSVWIPVKYWVNDSALINKDEIPDTIFINNQATVSFEWDMTSMKDRVYDIRAVSRCTDGTENESVILTGILDGQRPQVFGTPQPADGILNIDENILVRFNEPIEGGLLNQFNFDIKGTLNYYELKHEAYIRMNGVSDYASVPDGISFNDKSFTIEFWVRPDDYGNAVILSQGNDPETNLEIGLRTGNKTYFKIGNVEAEAALQFSPEVPSTAWQHMAYVFDYENGDIFIYQNDKIILELQSVSVTYNNSGKIYVGKSAVDGTGHFQGSIHELRIWSKFMSIGDVYSNQYLALSGNEVGLYGYWPIDEAFGILAIDKAANRHMEIFAPWETYPGGSSWNFSGNNYLTFFTGYFAIIPEMDYTLEFWFKDTNPADTVCLFSNQRGDGTEGDNLMDKTLSVLATPDGKIWVSSQGNIFEAVTNNYFNNSWHHFALVVRRRGNVIAFVDGEPQNEKENTLLGGIAGANMALGARIWNNPEAGSGEDMYFSGKLDEFRLWNLAKTRTQIKMDMNSKLNGNEVGLMVYFPFEGFYEDVLGVLQQEPTLENYDDDVNSTNAVPVIAGAFSTDAPDMKDVRPVQSIAYDFVASEDEIIINPKSYLFPQLEKNIIEITVEGVEDKYGNRMASPVTWTAYVHRNQVRWEDERRIFIKEIYKPYDFVSTIKNTGGQQIGFTITNLPPWLTAVPSSGVINPESTLPISFNINPALNIGEYNEDIILHTENGFDEKLPITVKVYKTPPSWNIDPSNFEYSMSMVGKVKIEGVLSTDVFDMVAAFVNDSVRGVANVRYVKEFDSYLVFLNVYGNVSGDLLEFRIWDASVGQILDDVGPHDVTFFPDGIEGTTINPVIFEATGLYRQYIALESGWNWVSFNKLSNKQNNLNQFFAALEPEYDDQIKTKDGYSQFTAGLGWNELAGIDSIDNRLMYQVKTTNNDTVVYSGEDLVPEDNPIELSAGWNYVGYIPDLTMDVNDALRLYVPDTSDVIKSQYAFSMYDPKAGWLGTLEVLQPGLGYMFKVKQAGTLIYPNTTVFKSSKIPLYFSPPLGWKQNLSEYESNLSVVAKIEAGTDTDLQINEQMVLGAFINDQCHGFVSPIASTGLGYSPFFLNVSNSNNGEWIKFRLYDGLTGMTYNVNEIRPFVRDAVYGSIGHPLLLTLKGITTGVEGFGMETFIRCYPNPFSNQVFVEFNGTGNDVSIDVLNATGSLVKQIFRGYPVSVLNRAVWDGHNGSGVDVASGLYYIRFVSGTTVKTVKISKTR